MSNEAISIVLLVVATAFSIPWFLFVTWELIRFFFQEMP